MNIDIIPATDLIDGRVVRLTRGDYATAREYVRDPLEMAKRLADIGVRRLHMVDLDGALASEPRNLRSLERVALGTQLEVQYGGGIKSLQALRDAFSAGAARVIVGSLAATDPATVASWMESAGPDRLIIGADTRRGRVAVKGWTADTPLSAAGLLARYPACRRAIVTDIEADGTLQGPSTPLYTELQARYPDIDITVSGGISSLADIRSLDEAGLRSVVVGKALYEGRITLSQLALCLREG